LRKGGTPSATRLSTRALPPYVAPIVEFPAPISATTVSRATRRSNPITVLAVALVLGGVALLAHRWPTRPGPTPCDRAVDPACLADAGPEDGPTPPPRDAPGFPELSAAEACRDVAYVCADLQTSDRIRIQRWRNFGGTMVVHVPLPDLPDAAEAHALQWAATAGVRLWNGQPFPILVDERGSRPAQVEVRWVPALTGTQLGVAHTQWRSSTGLSVLSLELVTRSPFGGGSLDPEAVRLAAAHEMGHALGLPHSDDPHDVMYPTNTANSLSARDYHAVQALYAFEDGTVIVR
jgi:hypothetical protein